MKKSSVKGDMLMMVIIFLINPLLGIIVTALYAWGKNKTDYLKALMVLLMLYLCALNTTKVPVSDMIKYLSMYENVPRAGYFGTLISFNHSAAAVKDIAYGTLVYMLYYLTFGNKYLFIFIVSFLGYWFMFMSIYKFGKENKLPDYMIVTQVLILSFFTQYFSMTFHLVRQVLAAAIFFYALTFRNTSFKKYLIWCIIAIATHSSVALLVAFSFVPMMKRKLKMMEIVSLVLFAAFSVVIMSSFARFLLNTVSMDQSLGYSINRVATMEGSEDRTGKLQMVGFVLTAVTILLFFVEWKKRNDMLYPIVVNMAFIISLMTLGMSSSPFLQKRFFFYIYSFLPFVYLILVRRFKGSAKTICFITIVILIFRFYLSLNNVFKYVPVGDALIYPYPLLIKLG